jgi:ribosomal protein S27AE
MAVMASRFGTLKCLMCGYVAGAIVDGTLTLAREVAQRADRRRCPRCRGSLYLERESDRYQVAPPERPATPA